MNKKVLSAILFGALMLGSTGTFVSCKDYDDDISNLQEQIDSQKTDLTAKVTAVEGSIKDLQTAQSGLQKGIDEAKAAAAAAKDAATKAAEEGKAAALEAQKKAIETAAAELAKVKTTLETAIKNNADAIKGNADAIKENTEAIKAAVAKAEADLAIAVGRIQTLEAFKTTTEEALAALANADTKLSNEIKALDAKVATALQELGNRLTATEAQIATLIEYKETSSADIAANKTAIAKLIADLEAAQAKHAVELGLVQTALNDYITSNNQAVSDLTTKLQGLNDEYLLTKAEVTRIAGEITKINAKLDLLSAALNRMVTHVSLYTTSEEIYYTHNFSLDLVSAKAVRTWTFGEGLLGDPIPFVKDAKETWENSFTIRVSPTNATLDASMIRLVNSEMKDLKGLVNIEGIEPYTGLVTRGISANGLWKVRVKLVDNYDEKAYAAAAQTEVNGATKDILYAVMINDNAIAENTENREVVSEYGITLGTAPKTVLSDFTFKVDATSVVDIKNRWGGSNPSSSENGSNNVTYEESKWLRGVPEAEPIFEGTKKNVKLADTDVRQGLSAYSVKAGKAFTVSLDEAQAKSIRGIYVTLDHNCAVESTPSEINAWKSYKVQGLNTVTNGAPIELTIPTDVNAEGDYIGFRVFAVNYDGSLVDPDGKAFYVYVGETAQTAANLTLSMKSEIVVPQVATVASATDAFSTAGWARAKGGKFDLVVKDSEGNDVTATLGVAYTNFLFKDKDKAIVTLLADASNLINDAAISTVTTVEMLNVTASKLKDGMTYTATITAKNGTSGIVAVSTIKFTKALPTFPASVYPFTNVLVNNNLKVYPVANGTNADYNLNNVWHGLSDNANLVFAEIIADPAKKTISYTTDNNVISAAAALVNPNTTVNKNYGKKFPMSVEYNYGNISYAYNTKTKVWEVVAHKTTWGQAFTIEFGNYVDDCTFVWAKAAPTLAYPGAVGQASYIALDALKITDWYGQAVDLSKMTTADSKEKKYMKKVTLGFLTGANFTESDEYYAFGGFYEKNDGTDAALTNDMSKAKYIKLVSKSNASQGEDVPTKVQLTFTDNFDFTVVKSIDTPFTMTFKK